MSVYTGPCNYGADESELPPHQSNPSGDLDMQNYRIVNLRISDAATVGIVSDWVGALNNAKVDWGGGTMTGRVDYGWK